MFLGRIGFLAGPDTLQGYIESDRVGREVSNKGSWMSERDDIGGIEVYLLWIEHVNVGKRRLISASSPGPGRLGRPINVGTWGDCPANPGVRHGSSGVHEYGMGNTIWMVLTLLSV